MNWLAQNIATIIIAAAVFAIVGTIVAKMIINKKKGKSSCGCNCSCCSISKNCHNKNP